MLVHAVVHGPKELELIKNGDGNMKDILAELKHAAGKLKGGAGTDLAELIEYYNSMLKQPR